MGSLATEEDGLSVSRLPMYAAQADESSSSSIAGLPIGVCFGG